MNHLIQKVLRHEHSLALMLEFSYLNQTMTVLGHKG